MVRSPPTHPRNVRIGVAWQGRLVHEEILDRRVDVHIGQRAGSTVQLAAKQCPGAPEHLDMLLLDEGRYYLILPTDAQARVSLRGAQTPRTPMLVRGQRAVLVDDLPGGSVQLGDLTLLFQFVQADLAPLVTRQQIVLRLGLVHQERLIADRVFTDVRRVTVGAQKELDIVLPDDDYRGAPVTFRRDRNGAYTLQLAADHDVLLASDGPARDADALCATGRAKRHAGVMTCALPLGTRGRLALGAHTLLFQVLEQTVTVPAPRARSWQDRLLAPLLHEPVWTTSLLAAVLLVGALVGQALLYERATGQFLSKVAPEEMADRQLIEIEVAQKDPPPTAEPPQDDAVRDPAPSALQAPEPPKSAKVHREAPSGRSQPQTEGDTATRNARALEHTVASALRDQNGASVKLFTDDPTAELRASKDFGHGEATEPGGPGHAALTIEGAPSAGRTAERIIAKKTDFGPRDHDIAQTKPQVKADKPIHFQPLEGPEGGDKDQIARKIASRAPGVKACYEAALRDNPEAGGKIRVNFTIGTAGTVTDVQVVGTQGSLAECIEGKFRAIRGLPILSEARVFNQTFLLQKD